MKKQDGIFTVLMLTITHTHTTRWHCISSAGSRIVEWCNNRLLFISRHHFMLVHIGRPLYGFLWSVVHRMIGLVRSVYTEERVKKRRWDPTDMKFCHIDFAPSPKIRFGG